MPFQTNPSGIGSSNDFAVLEVTNTNETNIVKNIADNTFSFPLQNVVDHVPQRIYFSGMFEVLVILILVLLSVKVMFVLTD